MSGIERFGFGVATGVLIGLVAAAYAQNNLDDRAVASGFLVHKSTAYQLVKHTGTTDAHANGRLNAIRGTASGQNGVGGYPTRGDCQTPASDSPKRCSDFGRKCSDTTHQPDSSLQGERRP